MLSRILIEDEIWTMPPYFYLSCQMRFAKGQLMKNCHFAIIKKYLYFYACPQESDLVRSIEIVDLNRLNGSLSYVIQFTWVCWIAFYLVWIQLNVVTRYRLCMNQIFRETGKEPMNIQKNCPIMQEAREAVLYQNYTYKP